MWIQQMNLYIMMVKSKEFIRFIIIIMAEKHTLRQQNWKLMNGEYVQAAINII